MVKTVKRETCETNIQVSQSLPNTEGINECDTDADTCCLGKNFIIWKSTRREADVYAYDKSYKPITNVPIVTGATAYDDPRSGNEDGSQPL